MNYISLFEEKIYLSIKNRLHNLSKDATHVSNKMTVNQMLVHCQEPLLLSLEDTELIIPETDDFDELKNFLIELVELFYQQPRKKRRKRPTFGEFSSERWGHSQFKHLDHHFNEFNA
ncbi:MAG: hypothetical protein P8L72_03440 [Flavobacteriaceae bacterium]|nr:hypothetical protein [Flavobacteriaceae bacterium]